MSLIFSRIKYPKILFFIITIIIGGIIFYESIKSPLFHDFIFSLGYIGTLIGGFFYVFGFTSSPSSALLLVLSKEQNFFLFVLIAGIGSLISNFLMFKFIRFSFYDELNLLKKERFIMDIDEKFKKRFKKNHHKIYVYISSIFIASPLPTEIGVTMMASNEDLSLKSFLKIVLILHVCAIVILFIIGNLI
ncbi:MAG: hypothetical protein PHX47_03080 [Candidatus ainarchaeum sp.]|nr:hypothetical protein [Candidatus ainarchaeum sp.]